MENHRFENIVLKHKMQNRCTQKIQRTPTYPPSPKNNPKKRLCRRGIMNDH